MYEHGHVFSTVVVTTSVSLNSRPSFRLSDIKAKTRPGIEANDSSQSWHSFLYLIGLGTVCMGWGGCVGCVCVDRQE